MAKKRYSRTNRTGADMISGEKYRAALSVAAGALSEVLTPGTAYGSAARLARRLEREVGRFLARADSGEVSFVTEVLQSGNNRHILEDSTALYSEELRRTKRTAMCGKEPLVFRAASLYIERIGESRFDSALCRAFGDAVCMCTELSYTDIFSLKAMLCAALLIGAASGKAENAEALDGVFSSLRTVSVFDFDLCLSHSEAEKHLLLDPSGDYSVMTKGTKNIYRNEVARRARLSGKSDCEIAAEALDKARAADREMRISGKGLSETDMALLERRRHIGAHILSEPGKSGGGAYFVLLFSLTALLCAALTLATPWGLLALFPIWEAVKTVLDCAFSRIFASNPLPELDPELLYERDGKGVGVLTVITSLLCGEKSDAELFERLERLYLASRIPDDDRAFFGILGDFTDSPTADSDSDRRTLAYAKRRIAELNEKYGRHFALFVRKRTFCESEGMFMGWERKRGAVIELVRFLRGGKSTTFSEYPDFLPCREIKYVVTLDSDTNMGMGSLSRLVGKALHPLNRPVIDGETGLVTAGFGIMQPGASPTLSSARRTPFSRLMCGEGGIDVYSGARFDLYQTLFGKGIFCGKGIFDVDAFNEAVILPEAFPEGRILSHDILEGARLRCAAVSDIVLTDSFPKNPLSYLKRSHRWIRGDVQNLVFLRSGRFSEGGKECVLPKLSRFELFDNARRSLTPVFSFAAAVVSGIPLLSAHGGALLFAALSPYFVPFVLDIVSGILSLDFKSAARRYFSAGVCAGVWQSFLRMLYLTCMLPKTAFVTIGAVSVSLYRTAVSHRGLLEWQTAAQSDLGDGSLLCYVTKNFAGALVGAVLFAVSGGGLMRLISFGWFLFPLIAYLSSRPVKVMGGVKKADAPHGDDILRGYAYDIWRFFAERVNENESFLPPDNVQFFPTERTAHRTSPTNIGLYLASLAAACDFGFIDAQTLFSKLSSTLDTLEALPKVHGQLYNWYDTEKAAVLEPRFISSVDCGNFAACLILSAEGAKDYINLCPELEGAVKRLEKLLDEADFSVFYDFGRNLFSVGLHEKDGEYTLDGSYYDLCMSEARTMSYIAAARAEVPPEHWASLSRVLISDGGYIGLASWSGTAFEYFMPCLFLPSPEGSLASEALAYAFRMQKRFHAKTPHGSVFGTSESGYFSFDADMNYAYRAFGVPSLALRCGGGDELVISPYSSFLFLPLGKSAAIQNLERLKKCGMYGEYGFYEALDFTPKRVGKTPCIVKSVMSHHLGMSFLALCNSVFEGRMRKRFMRDAAMASAAELTEEKIPVNAVIKKLRRGNAAIAGKPPRYSCSDSVSGTPEFFPLDTPFVGAASVGGTSLAVSSSGHMRLVSDGMLIFDRTADKYLCTRSLFVFAGDGGETMSVSPLPLSDRKDAKEVFSFSGDAASGEFVYLAKYGGISLKCRETLTDGLLRVRLETDSEEPTACAFFALPVLSSEKKHAAHPAFSSLAVEAEYDVENKIVVFRRRPYGDEKAMFLAVGLADTESAFSFDTRTEDIFGTQISSDSFREIMRHTPKGNTGACISPGMLIMSEVSSERPSELLAGFGDSAEKAVNALILARGRSFDADRSVLAESFSKLSLAAHAALSSSTAGARLSSAKSVLSEAAFFGSHSIGSSSAKSAFRTADYGEIWKYGISGDYPIAVLRLPSAAFIHEAKAFLAAARLAALVGLKLDLCIVYSEISGYDAPFRRALEAASESMFPGASESGIYFVNSADAECAAVEACASASYVINSSKLPCESRNTDGVSDVKIPVTKVTAPQTGGKGGISVAGGRFTEKGFTVEKAEHKFPSPYSHVLAGRNIASLVTQDSLGFTFCGNSSEKRLTGGLCDLYSRPDGERLLLFTQSGEVLDLCAVSEKAEYFPGGCRYTGCAGGFGFEISVFVCEKYRAKVIDVNLERRSDKAETEGTRLCMAVKPVMGSAARSAGVCGGAASASRILFSVGNGTVRFRPAVSESGGFGRMQGFLTLLASPSGTFGGTKAITESSRLYGGSSSGEHDIAALSANAGDGGYRFVLGACRDGGRREYDSMMSALLRDGEEEKAHRFGKSLTSESMYLSGASSDNARAMSELFGVYLPYQNAASRFIGRCGYYQAGGAYGFRDGLQDVLCLMQSKSLLRDARTHLLRSAARQFEDGGVLHWWHDMRDADGTVCRGSRSRCSDDYLWLVYVTAEYVRYTGDKAVLDVKVPYIEGEELGRSESEKYISARLTSRRESLFDHLERAVRRSVTLIGPHGLPLIGSCDWSDGLNGVGKGGRGESVWLAMFLRTVLDDNHFSYLCGICGRSVAEYVGFSEKLGENIRVCAVDSCGKYFIRGFFDDGTPFGSSENPECRIDLLPQAFYPLTDGADTELSYSALCEAYRTLYVSGFRLTSLFTPPFTGTSDSHDPGYIRGYAPGLRENGGQYTHAAVWGAMGMFAAARAEKDDSRRKELISMGEDIFSSINPILRTSGAFGEDISLSYKVEPYALCADVYTNVSHLGRGGWSLYTGSAGWYRTVMLKYVFGAELTDILTEKPKITVNASALPFANDLDGCTLEIDLGEGRCISVAYSSDGGGKLKAEVSCSDGTEATTV